MSRALAFLTRRRGGDRWHWTDVVTCSGSSAA